MLEVSEPILFHASAGTGKTTTLAKHYVRTAFSLWQKRKEKRHGDFVEPILAITFTEAAALEMREKIARILEELAIAHANNTPLPEVVESLQPLLHTPDLNEFIAEFRASLPKASIQTIHSFCLRLILDNSPLLHLDPGSKVLSEEESEGVLRQIVQEKLCTELSEKESLFYQLALVAGLDRTIGGLVELLKVRRGEGKTFRDFQPRSSSLERKVFSQTLTLLLEEVAEKARRVRGEAKKAAFLQLQEVLEKERSALEENPNEWRNQNLYAIQVPEACASFWEEKLPPQGYLAGLEELLAFLVEVEDDYAHFLKEHGFLDYDAQLFLARKLLKERKEELALEPFAKIFVDEFQDVNELQWEIVQRLAALSAEKTSPAERAPLSETLFLVGDAKQSIYGFRGAEVSVFLKTEARLLEESEKAVSHLNVSFRSHPSLLHFTNHFFAFLGQKSKGESPHSFEKERGGEPSNAFHFIPDREHGDWLHPGKKENLPPVPTPPGAYAFGEDWTGCADELRKREAGAIVQIILELTHSQGRFLRCTFSDIAILFRTRNNLSFYEQALSQARIPYQVMKGRSFYRCQEIADIRLALRALLVPDDAQALFAFLRSPLVGLSDEAILSLQTEGFRRDEPLPLRKALLTVDLKCALEGLPKEIPLAQRARDYLVQKELSFTMPPEQFLNRIVLESHLYPVLLLTENGAQKVANVKKLLELSRKISREKPLASLFDLLEELEGFLKTPPKEKEVETISSGVQLMTIHQAKGREFPVVFLADSFARFTPHSREIFLYDKGGGIALKWPSQELELTTHAHVLAISKKNEAREREELKRLLYVALTRAARYLFLGTPRPKKDSPSFGKWIREFLSEFSSHGALSLNPLEIRDGEKMPSSSILDEFLKGEKRPCAALLKSAPRFFPPPSFRDSIRTFTLSVSQLVEAWLAEEGALFEPSLGWGGERRLGELVHSVLARLNWALSAEEKLAQFEEELSRFPELSGARKPLAWFFQTELAASLAQGEVFSERPFQLFFPFSKKASLILRGTLDALALGGKPLLVEFKFAARRKAQEPFHQLQLALYHYAAEALLKKPVSAHLVYLKSQEAVPLRAPLTEKVIVEKLPFALANILTFSRMLEYR